MLVVLTPRLKLHQQKKNSQEKQLDVQYLNTDIHTDLCVALSKPGLSNNEKWKVYNSICLQNPDISAGEKKQFENESTWSDECNVLMYVLMPLTKVVTAPMTLNHRKKSLCSFVK